jgi:hypothetical protein
LIASLAAVIAAIAIGASGAQAAGVDLFGSKNIQDDSVRSIDVKDGTLKVNDLRPGAVEALSGSAGTDGIAGLYYVTAKYGTNAANDPSASVNEGAIATVACDNEADTAISGGVQTLGLGGQPAAVASSFPGRMHWADETDPNNYPKADRLDGWIVQFDAQRAPVKADIWALCATGTDVPQTVTTIS